VARTISRSHLITPLATHVSVFLRERLPLNVGPASVTCDTYALALRLFCEFAARRLKVRPSALGLNSVDAPLVLDFLTHWKPSVVTVPLPQMFAWPLSVPHALYRVPGNRPPLSRFHASSDPMKRADTRWSTNSTATKCKPARCAVAEQP